MPKTTEEALTLLAVAIVTTLIWFTLVDRPPTQSSPHNHGQSESNY